MERNQPIFVPPEGPPLGITPSPEIYAHMGDENIFKMLADFYAELEKTNLRPMFPEDMQEASKKTAAFFVFLLGGPPLYQQKFGAPMMRKRHLPFTITEEARQTWLGCFRLVLKDADIKYSFPKQHLEGFLNFLDKFSRWMVNAA